MKKIILTLILGLSTALSFAARGMSMTPVEVTSADMTAALQAVLNRAAEYDSDKVIMLAPGTYHIYRGSATRRVYYASNTTTETENPDQTKHIGLYLKKVKNLTVLGYGATIVTHGEMTPLLLDSCDNVRFEGLTITAADPTVPEMTVTRLDGNSFEARVHPTSHYRVEDGKLTWHGEGWEFRNGIAQIYDPEQDITWRSWYPVTSAGSVVEMEPGLLRFNYDKAPDIKVGQTFQMRDGIRNEMGALVTRSRNTVFENMWFASPGNFSTLFQFSDGVTIRGCHYEPLPGSGRTNAAFADMLHVSGCKGKVEVTGSRFLGAHDDPINVHGTHLKVIEKISPTKLRLRFSHGQTFGFEVFAAGDKVAVTDPHTLLSGSERTVRSAKLESPREMVVELDKPLAAEDMARADMVLENLTYNPDVEVSNCYFARLPTRGILVSTRGRVDINYNTFVKLMMSAVLIADDAQSWFESGPVRQVQILGNRFIDCAGPVIFVAPENEIDKGAVHRNIVVQRNSFETRTTDLANIKSVDGFTFINNLIIDDVNPKKDRTIEDFIRTTQSVNVTIKDNRIETK